MTLLRAAKRTPSPTAVHDLRQRVAQKIYEEYVQNGVLASTSVRSVIQSIGLTLNAFLADIKHKQWASQIEMAAAADHLNLATYITDGTWIARIGPTAQKPRSSIHLIKGHYVLKKLHKKYERGRGSFPIARGGMQPRTRAMATRTSANGMPVYYYGREYVIIDMHSENVGAPPAAPHVSVSLPQLQNTRPMRAMYLMTPPATLGRLRILISRVLGCRPETFTMTLPDEPNDPLLDTMVAPGTLSVQPRGHAVILMDELFSLNVDVCVVSSQQAFTIRVNHYETHPALVLRIAGITGIPVQEVHITDHAGGPWSLEEDTHRTTSIRVEHIMRGGMFQQSRSRSRSREQENLIRSWGTISPTEPFHGEGSPPKRTPRQQEPEVREEARQIPASEIETTPRRNRSPSPSTISIMPASVTSTRIRSRALPSSPTAAQVEVARPVYTRLDHYVGRIKAHPTCLVEEIIEELHRKYMIHGQIQPDPRNASTWQEVDWIMFPPREPVGLMRYATLFDNIWEKFQHIRQIPVLQSGRVSTHVVMPQELSLREAQRRVERWAGWRFAANIVTIGSQEWVLHLTRLPQNIINAYILIRAVQGIPQEEGDYELEEVHEEDIENLRYFMRGGARGAADHRAMMLTWAKDIIDREAPEFAGPTSDLLLKAEGRTVSALLNARSPAQVRDVISSAWKRAHIQIPQSQGKPTGSLAKANLAAQRAQQAQQPQLQQGQQPQRTTSLSQPSTQNIVPQQECMVYGEDLAVMIASHAKVLAQIIDMLALLATKQDQATLQASVAQCIGSLASMSEAVKSLESRIDAWETGILPHILDRLEDHIGEKETPAPTIIMHMEQDKEHMQEDPLDQLMNKPPPVETIRSSLPTTAVMTPRSEASEPKSILRELETRSLRSQARKITRAPMAPFGGRSMQ